MGSKDNKTPTRATKATRQATDTEMLDWLAMRCFLPNDHPEDDLIVIVPERFSPLGSFTLSSSNDEKAFRKAVLSAMTYYFDK